MTAKKYVRNDELEAKFLPVKEDNHHQNFTRDEKTGQVSRETLYKDSYPAEAYRYCLLGATDNILADYFGVSKKSINTWKTVHPEFKQALLKGKHQADAYVAESLYNRCLGYEYQEERVNVVNGEIVITPVTRHMPADSMAIKFFLANRQTADWKITPPVQVNTQVNVYKPVVKRFDGSMDEDVEVSEGRHSEVGVNEVNENS